MEYLKGVQAVRDVARVAVAEQNHAPGSLGRHEPARQLHAICGLEANGLVGKPNVGGSHHDRPRGEVDETGLKEEDQRQQGGTQTNRDEQSCP